MVLLGGLEIVAAGYLLNEIHKDREKEEEGGHRKRRNSRKDDRRHHHHRHDSPHRPNRPSQSLYPPPGPQRPCSAPPPQTRPSWPQGPPPAQPQQMQFHPPSNPPQQWRPAPLPNQGQQWQPQAAQSQPHIGEAHSYFNNPAPPPPSQQPNNDIPPGWHLNLRTGKLQQGMLPQSSRDRSPPRSPPQLQLTRHLSDYSSSSSEDDDHRRDMNRPPLPARRSFSRHRPAHSGPWQNYSHPEPNQVASPRPGYAELDAETPGRYRPYDSKAHMNTPPPSYRA